MSTSQCKKYLDTKVVEDWEQSAKQLLSRGAYDYVNSGSGAEETLDKNRLSFRHWDLIPRVLTNVQDRDLSVELFQRVLSAPILLAPVGFQTVVHPDGELASSRSAAKMNIPYIASTVSSYSLEEIGSKMGNTPKYFQLYWPNDDELAASFIRRAEAANYDGIVVTVDTALLGWREKDLQNQYFPMETGAGMANFISDPVFKAKYLSHELTKEQIIGKIKSIMLRQDLTWERLVWLKEQTSLPIVIKGILHKDDAKLATECGMDGIIVSNHGGRQLDGVRSSLEALPAITESVQGKIPVLFDGGIRRGSDVLKAIALGADAVLIGRPYVYGLAHGEIGVTAVLTNLIKDLDTSLALIGANSIPAIDASFIEKSQLYL